MTEEMFEGEMSLGEFLEMTTEIVSAFVSNNTVDAAALPGLIESVHSALASQGARAVEAAVQVEPAVSVRRSISQDHLVCLECGRTFKTLKRHLRAEHDLSPTDYRSKWGLPADYPMVAPNYSKARSAFAKEIGLGRVSEA